MVDSELRAHLDCERRRATRTSAFLSFVFLVVCGVANGRERTDGWKSGVRFGPSANGVRAGARCAPSVRIRGRQRGVPPGTESRARLLDGVLGRGDDLRPDPLA